MASIMALPGRLARRRVLDPETIGRIPAARVPRVSIQIAHALTARNRTGRTLSILPRTVHIQIDHIQIARALIVPGRRDRDSTARQGQVGERGVKVWTIEKSSLLHEVELLIAEVLVAQRNRIASL
jgi:hypothetical protein